MRLAIPTACVLLIAGVLTGQLLSQDDDRARVSPEEAMMQKWMEYMTPGEAHAELSQKAGQWNLEVQMWMAPGAPPVTTRATSEHKLIMGGRYLLDRTLGEFQGQPFEGLGITSYDNLKKKYVALWIDNHSTGFNLMEGLASSGVFTFVGEQPDLMTGGTKKARSVETIIDANTWKMEAYEVEADGSERKTMEIVYRRAR